MCDGVFICDHMPLWFLWKLNVVDYFQTKEGICTEYEYYVMKHNLERFSFAYFAPSHRLLSPKSLCTQCADRSC